MFKRRRRAALVAPMALILAACGGGAGDSAETTSDEITVPGNHRDLATAVRNLLDNAVRHTPEEGSIDVEASREGRRRRACVRAFYRVDSARARGTGGTGLGLFIVKHVVEGHGGSLSVKSALGSGSSFTIRLPAPIEGATATDH